MVKNSLREGQVRLGWLFDGNPDTPEIAVMLQDTDEQIVLTVPIKVWDYADPYTRWFRHGARPPRVLTFEHDHGSVVLVGCRAAGMSSNLVAGVGEGASSLTLRSWVGATRGTNR